MTDPQLIWLDGKRWAVDEDWSVTVDGTVLHVPRGFVFDLASIPRILWVVKGFAPFELSTAAPLAHDYIYRHKGWSHITRRQADRYFRLIMAEEGVGRIRRTLAWLAVRAGGWIAWRKA